MEKLVHKIGYLRSIDFLRGIAAIGVCLEHIGHGLSYESKNTVINGIHHLTSYGYLGVPIFFTISGFCIHRKKAEQIANRLDEPIEFRKYWKRRFFRLYPAYFVACILSALSLFVAIKLNVSSITVSNYPGDPYLFLGLDLAAHLLMIHCFFHYFDTSLGNGALWTIAREEQYYLLYFPLLKIRKFFGILGCLMVSVIASIAIYQLSLNLEQTNPSLVMITKTSSLFFWPHWILGMLSVEIVAGIVRGRTLLSHSFFFLAGILIIVFGFEASNNHFWVQQMLYGIGSFLIITWLATNEIISGWKSNKIFGIGEFVGSYSYSLYLIHAPFILFATKVGRLLGTKDSVPLFSAMIMIIFLLIQIPAYLLYYLVERHGQTQRNRTDR